MKLNRALIGQLFLFILDIRDGKIDDLEGAERLLQTVLNEVRLTIDANMD